MVTEKRFVYYEHKGADYILDTPNTELDFIEMLGDALEPEEIVEKLNELVEENNGFKINEEFKNKAYSDLLDNFTQLKKKYQKSKKENKELKKELDSFNPVVFNDMIKGTVILYNKGDVE